MLNSLIHLLGGYSNGEYWREAEELPYDRLNRYAKEERWDTFRKEIIRLREMLDSPQFQKFYKLVKNQNKLE
jgi:hypothetical protein